MTKARASIGAIVLAVLLFSGLVWAQDNANEIFVGRIDGLQRVSGVAVDALGNLYVVNGKRLSYMSPAGTILNSTGLSFKPYFVKVGPDGKVYVGKGKHSVSTNSPEPIGEVLVFDSNLNYLYSLGGGAGEFVTPMDLDFDAQGNIYVCDVEQDVIKVYNPQGEFLYSFGQHGIGDGYFNQPHALAIDKINNEIYIADKQLQPDPQDPGNYFSASRVQVYTLNGQFVRAFGNYDADGLITPTGLALYSGRLYATDSYISVVQVFDAATGQYLYAVYDDPQTGSSSMRVNSDLSISDAGLMYVASTNSDAIYIFGVGDYVNFAVSPSTLSFEAQNAVVSPVSLQVTITATGQGDVNWTASADQPWIVLSQSAGVVAAGSSGTIDITVDPTGLEVGQYSGTVTIASSGISKTITVFLTIKEPAMLSVTPQSLTFSGTFGGDTPPAQTVDINLSNAIGTAYWQASADSAWLGINPVQAGPGTTKAIVSVNISGLGPGSYVGHITITASGATGSPATVTVTLNIVSAGIVNVTTNLDEASFTVTGPGGVRYQGSGKNWSMTGLVDGVYTVVFSEVPGYITPAPQTATLSGGGVVNFSGNYQAAPMRIITAAQKGRSDKLRVYDAKGALLAEFTALKGGVDLAAGDLDGDGISEVVAGSARDGATVMVFSSTGQVIVNQKLFKGKVEGIEMAIGDLNGDGVNELVAVERSKAEIGIFNLSGGSLTPWAVGFNGFDSKIKDTRMTLADIDGDGAKEVVLISGAEKRHSPEMRVWKIDASGATLMSGTNLDVKHVKALISADVDADGLDDIVIYDGKRLSLVDGTMLMAITDGSDIVMSDIDGDGIEEIVVGKKDATIEVFELDGTPVGSFRAYGEEMRLSVTSGLLGY